MGKLTQNRLSLCPQSHYKKRNHTYQKVFHGTLQCLKKFQENGGTLEHIIHFMRLATFYTPLKISKPLVF